MPLDVTGEGPKQPPIAVMGCNPQAEHSSLCGSFLDLPTSADVPAETGGTASGRTGGGGGEGVKAALGRASAGVKEAAHDAREAVHDAKEDLKARGSGCVCWPCRPGRNPLWSRSHACALPNALVHMLVFNPVHPQWMADRQAAA